MSCCGWGSALNECESSLKQELYFGTRADEISTYNRNQNSRWGGGPASLLAVAEVDIAKPGYQMQNGKNRMAMEIGNGNTGPNSNGGAGGAYQQQLKNAQPKLKVNKILIHPGEINSFKSWAMNRRIIASHSDLHHVFVWDMNLQQCAKSKLRQDHNIPNISLVGHSSQPTYALGWSPVHPTIASGSKNGSILVWNLENYLDQTKGFCTGGDAKDESKRTKPDAPHGRVCKQVSAMVYPKADARKGASQEERS